MRRSRTAAQSGRRRGPPSPTDVRVPLNYRFAQDFEGTWDMTSTREIKELVAATRKLLRSRGYSARTRNAYGGWVERFLTASRNRRTEHLSRRDIEDYFSHLTDDRGLAPKTRNQASSALGFFFKEVLEREDLTSLPRARETRRVPVVLSHTQVKGVLDQLEGKYRLLAALMYGSGLRLTEAHRLRVKDIDMGLGQITVRDGKGGKDRWVMLPDRLAPSLQRQIDRVIALHREDRRRGAGWARLPYALAQKDPTAGYQAHWQFVFPATQWSKDPATNRLGRAHLSPSATQRKVKAAGRAARIPKPVTCHTLRRSFATQMLRAGYDVRTVQKLMGHRDVRTTMIYVEAVTDTGIGMRSPLDQSWDGDYPPSIVPED